jgi:crotonobetainyl-CoA:carnitine CoA-transferase CaiB-like acyl-CoA transferase
VTPVQTLDEYACHPHTVARHAVRTTNTRGGPGVYPAPAPVLDGDREARGRSQDARVGEHTADVLAELGHSEGEVARLVGEGAVALATIQPS